jgi:hypothetical protein
MSRAHNSSYRSSVHEVHVSLQTLLPAFFAPGLLLRRKKGKGAILGGDAV